MPLSELEKDLTEVACVVCFQPTDTGLATHGEAEWHIAFAQVLGVPGDQAADMLSDSDGNVPPGEYAVTWRVCAECVAEAKVGLPAPVLLLPGVEVPTLRHRGAD